MKVLFLSVSRIWIRHVLLAGFVIALVMVTWGISGFFYIDAHTEVHHDQLAPDQEEVIYPVGFCPGGRIEYARCESSHPLALVVAPLRMMTDSTLSTLGRTTDFDKVDVGTVTSVERIPMEIEDWYGIALRRLDNFSVAIEYVLSYRCLCYPHLPEALAIVAMGGSLLTALALQKYREAVETKRNAGRTPSTPYVLSIMVQLRTT